MNSFQLKVMAMLLMVLDHLYTYFPGMPEWFSLVGRIVAPIFFYLMVEGFFHTRSRKKYTIRLYGWSIFMSIGNGMLNRFFPTDVGVHNNIFLSLALAVSMLWAIDSLKRGRGNSWLLIPVAIAMFIVSFFTEASLYGVMMALIFYFFRGRYFLMCILYGTVFLGMTIGSAPEYTMDAMFLFDYQWAMLFALPFILVYNGKRGWKTPFSKYLFYVFYPLHLWVIYIIGYFIY
ncbi:TraX family protein [Bacillus sp. 1P06AnD]|uniref:TraX family protein n=1 Tax=Bacillus sp. 1P06AnD TaxID=3132208 RepID=UPI0039A2CC54